MPPTVPAKEAEATHAIVSRLAAQEKTPWYRKPNLRILYVLMFPACLSVQITSGFDTSMMNGLQAVDSWNTFFNYPRSALLGLMSASHPLGSIIALPFVPWVTDRWGRRWAIMFGSILMVIGAAIQTASVNFGMFVVSRVVLGLGIPFAVVAASSLVGELSHPNERAVMGSLFNAFYNIGSVVVAGVTLGTFSMQSNWGWRIPSLLQISPSALQIMFVFLVPESPRWLVSKGRGDEAYAILLKYHAEGDTQSEFVKAEYVQIEKTLELETQTSNTSWKELVASSGMRRRLLIGSFLGVAVQLSGNGLTKNYLAKILDNIGVTSNHNKNQINVAFSCWALLNAMICALLVSRFRRRVIYLIGTIFILVVLTGWTIASARFAIDGDQASSIAVIVLIFLHSLAYSFGINTLNYTYLAELFPFHVRAKGIAVFQWFLRMGGLFTRFIDPIGIENSGWRYYISYVVYMAFVVIFVWFLFPETAHRTLEEVSFLYEGNKQEEVNKRVEEEIKHENTFVHERKSSSVERSA